MRKSIRPIIAITMGDAAGVGPEIIAKVLSLRETYDNCRPVVIGDAKVMADNLSVARVNLDIHLIKDISEAKFTHKIIDIFDLSNIRMGELKMGKPQAMAGKASVEYLEKAIDLTLRREAHAVVTAPLSKEAMNIAGYSYAGHTEILAERTKTKDYAMMLVAGRFRVIHVSTHVSLRRACELVKKERIVTVIKLAYEALRDIGIEHPKIAVAGLNPHAGEGALFGDEEIKEIAPGINEAKSLGIHAIGPVPPDTVFMRANNGEYDVVVAMYHDQGHIPTKMIGFRTGINMTVGLPIIRTSVDHGTGYRRAGLRLGTADPQSLIEAMKLAATIARNKIAKSR